MFLMPTSNFGLKTEYDVFSKALIVDEVGELPTLLVDALLNHGCLVNYFGKESKKSLDYLQGKDNFVYLNTFEKENFLGKIDYFFYFPSESFSELSDFSFLLNDQLIKSLVCIPLSFLQKEEKNRLTKQLQGNVRITYIDCFFGPRIKSGFLGELFSSAIEKQEVSVAGSSAEEIYPVYAKDLVKELVKLIFSLDTEGKEYFLRPKEKTTLFTLTSLIKNSLPEVTFSFSEENQERVKETTGTAAVKINFSLEEKIEETIDWFQRNLLRAPKEVLPVFESIPSPVIESVPPQTVAATVEAGPQPPIPSFEESLPKKESKKEKVLFRKIIFGLFLFFLLLFVFFLVPIGLSIATGSLGANKIVRVKEQVEKGNLSLAIQDAEKAQKLFAFSKKTMTITGPFYGLIGFRKQMEVVNEAFPLVENLINAVRLSLLGIEQAVALEKSFFGEEETDWSGVLGSVKANFSSAYEQASLAQASLEKIEPAFKFFKQMSSFEKIKSALPETREVLLKSENFVTVLPKILGVGEIKTYLVLFQNNMELRPTGGFIGSYGILRLEKGRLINFEVFDVYQADGQLKGHIEPPAKLKEHLGEATWYLRDSNWDPDFPVSAKRAQWFLDKETQISTDGTIAVNLEVVKKLLEALGEVEVTDYQEKITANNLFQKAEYYSELGTFPGSTQKKDFLASLAKEIFEKIKQAKAKDLLNVAGAFLSSLEQKEIMLYFDDPQVESVIANLGWEGSIRNYQLAMMNDSVFTDYLFINEANVGINKANYYVQRKIDQQVTIGDSGGVQEKLSLTYENLSSSENWPAGRYKNYLRVYLKKGAKLSSVFIDDPANPGLWLPFDQKYMDTTEEHGKTIYGFVFEVPIKSKRQIEINYELPEPLVLSSSPTSYLLMVQKQSGAFPSSYDLTISYPASFIPLRVIPSAIVGNQQLLISTKLNKDLIYQIDLAH